MLNFENTKVSIRRRWTDYSKVQALISGLVRNRRIFASTGGFGCYLDLGCGPNIDPTFCNIDYSWRPGIDVCWDVTRGLPFPDRHVGGIFSEHMLEHLPLEQAIGVLKECRRVLVPGAVLRIVVPDGEIYLREYAKSLAGEPFSMPYGDSDAVTLPIATPIASVNRIFRDHGHQFIWDFESMKAALSRAGFATVRRCAFGQGQDPKLLKDTPHRRIESLYVEAN